MNYAMMHVLTHSYRLPESDRHCISLMDLEATAIKLQAKDLLIDDIEAELRRIVSDNKGGGRCGGATR